ncbi:MAG: serine/threonine protein kinase [Faecalicatena sp.]|uniref:serine/threonine-protein kinase n=1 Tax=Faecalicatena sp. TaxID=2005360 RepID=UPI00258CB6B5|nr:serine/threonine-protein kinase [Faecalicatena sp.]MCI6464639.1 serine/threonine protein kinase [Faecalicatena sp.]MDY5618216.1 serine/threonine-protein kinase [Lachnospiraceae bacterium]
MLEIGSIVDGKYKILNKIGQGGMSIVYLAMNERANKPWAIKEIRKDGVSNYEVVKQNLIAETDILKRLNHPNLPSIIDVIDCDDTFLIVMDYIEGKPLSEALNREGAQPQEKVIEWAKQICDVLGYLHSRVPPIIYRDMKPSNVMLKPDGNIMIIDFGTAREYKSASIADTTCLGTQGYAAPEQFGGQGQTDARTDIYCLGATLYHLITGHNPCLPPYEMYPIRQWNPNLSSGLEEIILRCTQKNPNDRYQSCAELMYALEHYDELDHEYKVKQNRKWRTFLATSILTVVSMGACVGFKAAETSTTNSSYTQYLKNAVSAGTSEERVENYQSAIYLNPGEEQGYVDLLNKAFLDDDDFSQEEAAKMTEILGYKGSSNRSNESYLEADEKAYDDFAFQMGLAYYYYYEGNGNKPMSQAWFDIASSSTTLDSNKVERAKRLGRIAGYYANLNSSNKAGDSTTTYRDYWKDLTELVSGNLVEMDNVKTALVMYKEVVYQIGQNPLNFKAAGVTKEELISQLDKTKSRLNTDIVVLNESDRTEIEHLKNTILDNIEWARKEVDIAYTTRGMDKNEETGGAVNAGTGKND